MSKRIKDSNRSVKSLTNADLALLLLDVIPFAIREIRSYLRQLPTTSEDLTLPQMRILGNLWLEPANIKDLADATSVSVPAASRMIKLLTCRGLVECSRGITDKREIKVRLSKNGLEVLQATRDRLSTLLEERLGVVSALRARAIYLGLSTLREILTKIRQKEN